MSPAKTGAAAKLIFGAFEIPQSLRALVRAREAGLIALAALIGVIAGLVVAAMGFGVAVMHTILFGVPWGERLSALTQIEPNAALAGPTFGGVLFGLALWRS